MWASAPTGERRSVGSTAARRNRGPAGGRLIAAPTVKSLPGTFDEGTPAARFACLRRGTFHRRKVPKMRRGLRPPVPRWAPQRASPEEAFPRSLRSTRPSRSIPPPLPGFARASQIGQPLRLQNFPQRPHGLPRYRGRMLHTADILHDLSIFAVGARIARPNVCGISVIPSNVPASDFAVGADAHIGPCRAAASHGGCDGCGRLFVPPRPEPLLARGRLWPVRYAAGAQASRANGPMWASAPTWERRSVRSAAAFRRRSQADARYAPLRQNRTLSRLPQAHRKQPPLRRGRESCGAKRARRRRKTFCGRP